MIDKKKNDGTFFIIKFNKENINLTYFEKKDFEENEFLEVEYFKNEKFKKIKKQLIVDVSVARIEEFISLIYNNNKNLQLYKKENNLIYFLVQALHNVRIIFKQYLLHLRH